MESLPLRPRHCAVLFAGSPKLCIQTHKWDILVVNFASGSPISHCSFCYNGVVIEVNGATGVRFFPIDYYLTSHPCLQAVVQILCHYAIDPTYFEPWMGVPIPRLPSFLHWLDFGRGVMPYDCLSITTLSLRACGVVVPTGLSTPAGLFRWFVKGGYPYARRTDAGWREDAYRYAHPDNGVATEVLPETGSATRPDAH